MNWKNLFYLLSKGFGMYAWAYLAYHSYYHIMPITPTDLGAVALAITGSLTQAPED